jgi:transposase
MDVLTSPERRRRWTAEQKLSMVRESFEPGKSVSLVARQHGVNPNQLFHWRKLYQDGNLSAVKAGEEVVPASELADALKQKSRPTDDAAVVEEIRRVIGDLPSYGYRRVWGTLRAEREGVGLVPFNAKRIYRVMSTHGLLMERRAAPSRPQRRHDGTTARRPGRRGTKQSTLVL